MRGRCIRLAATLAVFLSLAGCSSDDEAPARLPDKLDIQAPGRVEVGESFKPTASAAADDGFQFNWNFGDGSRSQQSQPIHAYNKPGRHQLSLTLSNRSGTKLEAQTDVQAGNFAPLMGRTCSAGPESGWCWQMPLPYASEVRDMSFVDAEHGWAAGESGHLFVTADGGRRWERLMTPMTEGVTHLRFANANTGWAMNARSRRLMRSDDGGRHWEMVGLAGDYGVTLWTVSLSGPMVMSATQVPSPRSLVSDDGGASWRPLDRLVTHVGARGTLWHEGENGDLWLSSDGGRSFKQVHDGQRDGRRIAGSLVSSAGGDSFLVERGGSPSAMSFVRYYRAADQDAWSTSSSDLVLPPLARLREPVNLYPDGGGWAVIELDAGLDDADPLPRLMHTRDGGLQWTERPLPSSLRFSELGGNGAIDGRSYLARSVTAGGTAWLTVDSGATWKPARDPQVGGRVPYSIRRSAGGHLVAAFGRSDSERVSVSSDDGLSWSSPFGLPLPDDQASVVGLWFFSAQQGLALRVESLLATDDGGRSWNPRQLGELSVTGTSHSLHFTDDGVGWLVMRGRLYRSDDHGMQWRRVATPSDAGSLSKAQFIDAKHGWLTTRFCTLSSDCQDILHATNDGGAHWNRPSVPPMRFGTMRAQLLSPEVGLAAVDFQLWRTTDGGRSWQAIPVQRGNWYTQMHFRTAQEGWLIDSNIFMSTSVVFRTRDGGQTWRMVELPAGTGTLSGIHFADALHGLIIDQRGQVLRTEDGGDTWVLQSSGSETFLGAVFMLDAETAWIGGSGSAILATATGGL